MDFLKFYSVKPVKFVSRTLVIYAIPNETDSARVGLTVKKAVGNSVFRNKLKRCVREYFRVNQAQFAGWDLNFVPREVVKNFQMPDREIQVTSDLEKFGRYWKRAE